MSLRVKLNAVKSKLNGVDKVTGLKLELTTGGAGPTNATAAPQDAKIEFYERAGSGDAAKSDRLFATLTFQIKVDAAGKNPEMDGNNASPTNLAYEAFVRGPLVKFSSGGAIKTTAWKAPDLSSDFWVDLDLSAQGKNFTRAGLLYLPWESAVENNALEIGAKLLIAGTVEADVKDNNQVSVPLDHKAVPEDGSGTAKFDCIGVGMVYPVENALWVPKTFKSSAKAAKMVASTINVFLHDQILVKHSTTAAPITLTDLRTRFAKIFTNAGLPAPTLTEKTAAELTAAGFEQRSTTRGTRWTAKTALMADTASHLDTDGVELPFFDFWVVFEPTLTPVTTSEGAEAEEIADFDPSTSKKHVLWPTAVMNNNVALTHGCGVHPTLGATEYPANYLVTTIAHELGHALGLRHALMATGSGYDLGPAGHFDNARGLMSYSEITDGICPLGFFGPVHKSTLEKRFL